MSKLTLADVANLTSGQTAVGTINNNSALIETALENTLSRDGTTPNQMGASLDMNSNQIINLPAPSSVNSPARLIDVVSNPTITIPGTGTSGHVVPFLDGNNIWTGTNTFSGPLSGIVNSVKNFGAVGDGITDDTQAFKNAISYVFDNFDGGCVYVPEGFYYITDTLELYNIRLTGANRVGCYITCGSLDIPIIQMINGQNHLENITFFGKGIWDVATANFGDTGTFGATNSVILQPTSGSSIQNCQIFGGRFAVNTGGTDCLFFNNVVSSCYGGLWYSTGGSWYIRNIFDHNPLGLVGLNNTNAYPFEPWLALTAYTVGHVVSTGGYFIQCTTAGTSGALAPTLRNYAVEITDGSAKWMLAAPESMASLYLDTPASENRFYMVDLTSNYHAFSATVNSAASLGGFPYTSFTDSVLSQQVNVGGAGTFFQISSSAIGGVVSILGTYTGAANITDCFMSAGASVQIAAGVSNFQVSNNTCQSPAFIQVAAGASDYYNITNNSKAVVTDGGTGVHKTIAGNVQSAASSPSKFYGSVLSTNPSDGIGYSTGAGGAVTQATNKSTAVTLNNVTGTITMNGAALNAGISVAFTLNNITIAATDTVIVNIKSGATANSYTVSVDAVAAGSCSISLRNYTGGNLSEAVVLSFTVIKGVAA